MSNESKIDVQVVVPLLIQGLQGSATKELVKLTIDFLLQQPLRNIVPYSCTESSYDVSSNLSSIRPDTNLVGITNRTGSGDCAEGNSR